MSAVAQLEEIHAKLRACQRCPTVCGKAVHGPALDTRVMLIGQAPGVHEEGLGRPFAYTAGKTLFKWLGEVSGLDEAALRERIYFSVVARCFPGKSKSGKGDREPSPAEMARCSVHLHAEVQALEPTVIIAVGKVAISQVLGQKNLPLAAVVGQRIAAAYCGLKVDVVPLPHPSGVSRWPKSPQGQVLLAQALNHLLPDLKAYKSPARRCESADRRRRSPSPRRSP